MNSPLADRKLPGMQRALDGDYMLPVLSEILERANGPVALSHIRTELLKYVPGKRGVIAYHLAFSDHSASARVVYGKLYRKTRGQEVFSTLHALWQTSQARHSAFTLPQPLAYLPELGMVLQTAAAGRVLTSFSQPDELFCAVQAAAKSLAALHHLPLHLGAIKTFQEHVAKYCHPGPEVLAREHPEFAPLLFELIAMMSADESLQTAAPCPLHGDINLAQIFITPERAVFIDFDGFCRSHAALDVGNFLVTLAERFGEKSGELRHGFLEAYLAAAATTQLPALRTYQAFAYLRRAVISLRLQDETASQTRVLRLLQNAQTLMHTKDELL